jgi:hypothetical protein
VLSTTDMENALAAVSPRVEEAIAALFNLTAEEWRAQPARVQVKQLVDFQNSAQLAATLAASAKAHTDLESVAFAAVAPSATDDLRAAMELLTEQVAAITAKVGA